MSLYHVPGIVLDIPTDIQTIVNSIEKKVKPSELVILLSWLTENLDWEDRKRLIMQISQDWTADLATDLEALQDADLDLDDPNALYQYLRETTNSLTEVAKIVDSTIEAMNQTIYAIEEQQEEPKKNAASPKISKKRKNT